MSKATKIVLGVFLSLFVMLIASVGTIWNHRNVVVSLENRIDTQYTSNKSEYDKMWKAIVELTQVTELQAEHFKSVYTELISDRYNDTNLLFKSVQESNPTLDSSVYIQLQREISAGRTGFSKKQDQVVDCVREYNDYILHHPVTSMVFGYEKKDPNEYIVTSQRTEDAFKTKKDDVIDLKNKK